MEDSEILQLYWSRQERAIYETDLKYGRYCRSIARNILQNSADAEECVNDTYLDAWNAIPPNRPSILSTFLGKITRRIAIDRCRILCAQKWGGGFRRTAANPMKLCSLASHRRAVGLSAKSSAASAASPPCLMVILYHNRTANREESLN